MNILMVGSTPPVGQVLKRGLMQLGHKVDMVDNPSFFDDGMPIEYELTWTMPRMRYGDRSLFDIVHVHSPNLKKWLVAYPYVRAGVPLVCHWHGTDLRDWKKSFPVKNWFIRHAKMNLYSTIDLAWWIQKAPRMLLNCPVDTDLFKPGMTTGTGTVTFNGGAKSFEYHRIPHKKMPSYLQKFEKASIHNDTGEMSVDDGLFSIIAFECASCGLKVEQFPWMTREWVLQNASMNVICKKIEQLYKEAIVT